MSQPPMPFDYVAGGAARGDFLRIHSAPARTLPAWERVASDPFFRFLLHAQLFAGCGPDASLEEALLVAGANI